ncbi:class I SAM-dependent methyltransferase [Candidatus Woesearchaeota archaeon]|nr:class I SAM-dependent methyltransferase [Candidatus Woesearchaeota archaeon]
MDYYDFIAKGYDELHREEQSNKLLIIKNNIKINKKIRILDVGCGTGISSGFGCFVVGIDPSIGLLKQNNNKKILGVAENLPFKNYSFDYVVSITSIHNFKNIKKSINEIKRVGKENFVFSVLKNSKRFDFIKNLIEKNFRIIKVVEEEKDSIFFCGLQ